MSRSFKALDLFPPPVYTIIKSFNRNKKKKKNGRIRGQFVPQHVVNLNLRDRNIIVFE